MPIVIGGHWAASARRAGRIGDGYFPAKGDLPELLGEMRKAAEEAGRDPDAVEVSWGGGWVLAAARRRSTRSGGWPSWGSPGW